MDISDFMCELIDELSEHLFYGIEIQKEYIKYNKSFLLRVIAKRNKAKYNYKFIVHKNNLDSISINGIVKFLLKQ